MGMNIATARKMIAYAERTARSVDFDMAREATDQIAERMNWESAEKNYLVCLAEELEILGLATRH
jgi:hypothetical protein